MKPGASECRILSRKCAKTHLQATDIRDLKKFSGGFVLDPMGNKGELRERIEYGKGKRGEKVPIGDLICVVAPWEGPIIAN
jgi:hypothetical protein